MKKICLTFMVILFSILSFSQDIYIPDRPGYTYNAKLVGLHQMDLEMGFGYNYTKYDDVKSNLFYNTTAIRYGAFKHLEFRYQMDFGSINSDVNDAGLKGISVGVKVPIFTNDSIINVAIVGNCYLPNIGRPVFQIPEYSPSVTLAIQKSLGKFILFGNSGIFWDGFNPYAQGTASFAIYYFPTKVGFFVETFCMYSDRNGPMNCGDFGLVWNITDDFIFDFSCGLNYVKGIDNSFVNSGLSWRIPNKHK